jgi:ABC-2 type transport system ATP-binding protein
MGLGDHADRPVRQLSGGLRRRLEIARGILHRPRLLFLDEPTLGLDVPARRTLWQRLESLREERELTVVLTTHDMDEAARLCDRIGILNEARIVAEGTPRELCAAVGGDHVEFELDDSEAGSARLRELPSVAAVRTVGSVIQATVSHAPSELVALIEVVRPYGIHAVRMHEVSLEDAFLHFTGRTIGPGGELE